MEVILRRHAPTAGNLRKAYLGRTDEPLSNQGEALARQLEADPAVAHVLVSPLQRTRQTAAILYPSAVQRPIPGLVEMDFGAFEGKNWEDLSEDAAYRTWVDAGCTPACPGGESRDGFIRRCVEAFLPLLTKVEASGAPALHAVLHGGTLMALLSQLALPRRDYWDWGAAFCGGYRLRTTGDTDAPLRLEEAIPGVPLP